MTEEEKSERPPLAERRRAAAAANAPEKHSAPLTVVLTPTMRREFMEYAAAHGLAGSVLLRMMVTSTLEQAKAKQAGDQ